MGSEERRETIDASVSKQSRAEERGEKPLPGGHARLGLLMGIGAALAVLLTLPDPGLTIDEPLDVRPGRTYLQALRAQGWQFFDRRVVERVYRDNAEHPPLGRWLLGLASTLGEPFEVLMRGPDPTGIYVLSGRAAPALAFALLVGLIVSESARRWGRIAGLAAGWSLLAMPRAFAHAHLAALDTFLSLFWTASLLAACRALESSTPARRMIGPGVLWGLALLTKIHAWLLLPIVTLWAMRQQPLRRAVPAVASWCATGVALFVMGWPWLWYDTATRWAAHWSTSVTRASIQVEYFGRVFADRDVPWHYPWFYFLVTVPVGLHLLGLCGLVAGWRTRRESEFPGVLVLSIVLFLTLFSTRIPVYDGERLFLHVFPAWAMFAGLGFARVWERSGRRKRVCIPLAGFLLLQGYGLVVLHPFQLSYYNAVVGGLRGAERMGLELTYWGDAVDRVLLDRLAREVRPGDQAALVPTLYQGQGTLTTTANLVRRDVILHDENAAMTAEWLVVSRRRAYWRPALRDRLESSSGVRVFARRRQGVWLSAIWRFPDNASPGTARTGTLGLAEERPRDPETQDGRPLPFGAKGEGPPSRTPDDL
jgi:4-amino-4-deoxy-L-arabinose transferase-like glycosyltransferase